MRKKCLNGRAAQIFIVFAVLCVALAGCGKKNDNETTEGTSSQTAMDADVAGQIALDHAKIAADSATFRKSELKEENGKMFYDIEFLSGGRTYVYKIEKDSGKVMSFSNGEVSTEAAASVSGQEITAQEAKQIALRHAGVSDSDVTFIKVERDFEDGNSIYDVEFYSDEREYDYEIDVYTGEIRSYDFDLENYTPSATGQASSKAESKAESKSAAATEKQTTAKADTTAATSSQASGTDIGVEKAKEAALKHAGLSASDVQFLKAEKDYDHGRLIYDIEFFKGNEEYDYEIDGATGQVLEYDKDIEHYTPESNGGQGNDIGIEKAKEIALNHAGLSASDVTFKKAKQDIDDGVLQYEIEFIHGDREYEYEINGADGSILKSESDTRD